MTTSKSTFTRWIISFSVLILSMLLLHPGFTLAEEIPQSQQSSETLESETAAPLDDQSQESAALLMASQSAAASQAAEQVQTAKQTQYFQFVSEVYADDLVDLRRTLNGQLAEYRTAQQQYEILKAQHQQLNTLSSLEASVQATRIVLEKRAAVLLTYVTLLKLEVENERGIQPESGDFILLQLSAVEAALLRHLDSVRTGLDRDSLNTATALFAVDAEEIENIFELTQEVLQLGQAQSHLAATAAYHRALAEFFSSETLLQVPPQQELFAVRFESAPIDLSTPQAQRAYNQISLELTEVGETLAQAEAEIDQVIEASADSQVRSVSLDNLLTSAYAGSSQAVTFISELLSTY